jgi:hypothetical protein
MNGNEFALVASVTNEIQAALEQYDHRRALTSIARGAHRARGLRRSWLAIWPAIPRPHACLTTRCASMKGLACAA